MALNRRHFLYAALGGGALVLPGMALFRWYQAPSVAFGGRRSPHYFVFYYMMGGWDLTLLTEPRPGVKGVDVSYRADEVFEAGGHRFGPAMAPLRPFFDRTAVIRGIKATALNHPQARYQLVTGVFKEPGVEPQASIQSRIAKHFGREYALPNISSDGMRPAAFLGSLPAHNKPLRIRSPQQLKALTEIKGAPRAYAARIAEAVAERDAAFARARGVELAKEFATYAELARSVRASDLASRLESMRGPNFDSGKHMKRKGKWGSQAHLAVEVLRHDLAPVVTVGSGEFDAHNRSDFATHRGAVTRGMETVAAICQGLDRIADGSGTLLDRTTVVVCSEFSRAPYINELGGKHHWPANAMILVGKGVARRPDGQPVVFGECDEMVFPRPIDPATGAAEGRGADDLTIHHGLSTVAACAGMDPLPLFGVEPIPSILG